MGYVGLAFIHIQTYQKLRQINDPLCNYQMLPYSFYYGFHAQCEYPADNGYTWSGIACINSITYTIGSSSSYMRKRGGY